MTTVRTDLRNTREAAVRIRSQSFGAVTATNVQNALKEIATTPRAITTTSVSALNSPYQVQQTDTFILVDTSGGPVQLLLQAAAVRAGLELDIKDATGNADTNPITLTPNGAEAVDGMNAANPMTLDSKFVAVRLVSKTGGYAVA